MPIENNEPREEVYDQPGSRREQAFDALAKGLANNTISRGDALKWAGRALAGALVASIPGIAWAQNSPQDPSGKGGAGVDQYSPQAPSGNGGAGPEQATSGPQLASSKPSGGGQGGGCKPPCRSGTTCCYGACIDTNTNTYNCGACGNACTAGKQCQNGACVCPSGWIDCSGTCVYPSGDVKNCGGCGIVCRSDQACRDGKCVCWNTETTDCSGQCVYLSFDNNNCGGCGIVCDTSGGKYCHNGSCQCPTGYPTECSGKCVDLSHDTNNCGACGNVCPSDQTCVSGTCQSGQAGDYCTSDSQCGTGLHCGIFTGTCQKCPSDQLECNGQCLDGLNDTANCGWCGNACPSNQPYCCDGVCQKCPCGQDECPPTAVSNGYCIDPASYQTDNNNCGGCGGRCIFSVCCPTTLSDGTRSGRCCFYGCDPTTQDGCKASP
jgi:hypothetical protein